MKIETLLENKKYSSLRDVLSSMKEAKNKLHGQKISETNLLIQLKAQQKLMKKIRKTQKDLEQQFILEILLTLLKELS